MFEEGIRLKSLYGKDSVFDYSLGNPDLPPPEEFINRLRKVVTEDNVTGVHGYMPNGGWPEVRDRVALHLTETNQGLGVPFAGTHVVMTVGAAGAMNCIFKTLLDPGDEVIALAPFFMEYRFYVENHAGVFKVSETDKSFRPNLDNILAAVTSKTRAIIVNSPNNPTGTVYTDDELKELGEALYDFGKKRGRPIFLVADEPYRKIVFGGTQVPSIFQEYKYSIAATSFSKDLSIPGERIGYVAINPLIEESEELSSGIILSNRILGSVNAPSIMQRVVKDLLCVSADMSVYEARSSFLADSLIEIGYNLIKPQGTFYLFPETPIPDDLAFIEILQKELILAVPGSGFGRPGFFRLSLCLDESKIRKSVPSFARAFEICQK
jgi:aspartate aminotransferase